MKAYENYDIWRIVYTFLFTLLLPIIFVRLWWRGRSNPAYRSRLKERLGQYDLGESKSTRLWIHAVSVGEVNAAVPLIRQINETWPGYRILVTTMTPTGADQLKRQLADDVDHRYVPYDHPWFVSNALKHVAPTALIIMETEIWPNLIHFANKYKLPIIFMNMRLSEKSFSGYRKIRLLIASQLSKVSVIAAQTENDAKRVKDLGARQQIIKVVGNIKYDAAMPEEIKQRGIELRKRLGAIRLIWIAASTGDGEDEQVLKAHESVIENFPDALLILVPRHPERFKKVFELCQQTFKTTRRTQSESNLSICQIYLLDTMGELLDFYAACDISFVGGSLVPTGGHNVLEPWLLGKPVIVGPSMFNFSHIAAQALEHEAMIQVSSAVQLADTIVDLAQSQSKRNRLINNAKNLLEQNKGALQASIHLLEKYLKKS